MPVSPIPEGHQSLIPYLVVRGAAAAIDFYKSAFGATEMFRMPGPAGRVGHAQLLVNGSVLMLSDEHPEMNFLGPQPPARSPVGLMLYVEDCDAVFDRAVAAGATVLSPVRDQFYGDRSGTLIDPFGHTWTVGTHKEDVSGEELRRRAEALGKPQG